MKPKTKEQKKIAQWSKELPKLTDKQKEWMKSKFRKLYTKHYKKFICLECGKRDTSYTPILANDYCPFCGNDVEYTESAITVTSTMFIIHKHKDYQVVRLFYVYKFHAKKHKPSYEFREAIQHWISPKGKINTMSLYSKSKWYSDLWANGEIEFRNKSSQSYARLYLTADHWYPYQQITNVLKQRGYKKDLRPKLPHLLFSAILSNSKIETLIKAEQYDLVWALYDGKARLAKYWPSIKIAIRNDYYIAEPSIWMDYLDLLESFNKDLRNAHYVCPKDLHKEHNRLLGKKNKIEANRTIQDKFEDIVKANKIYQKKKKKYLDIKIEIENNIVIRPLKNVEEFVTEATMMHHCVFANSYYEKDTLILTARRDDIPLQTIEFDPLTKQIVQIYGNNNHKDEYTPIVEKAIKDNLKEFQI